MLIQISSGLEYIHSQRLVHRDIKPENILIKEPPKDDHLTLQIADFGGKFYFVEEHRPE